MNVKLKRASVSDSSEIAGLADKIWHQHYIHFISKQQIDYMLNWMYNDSSLKEQMEEKHHEFYFITSDDIHLGFVSIHQQSEKEWFINKFYIDQDQAAKGIGTRVFQQIIELKQPETIRLTVNRENFKSINFYFKNGFIIEKVANFDIGQGFVMNDFVMLWQKKNVND